jgi:hypothetical protein
MSVNKYHAHTTLYNGFVYASKAEAEFARQLDLFRHAQNSRERVYSWERRIPFKLIVNDNLICTYVMDFVVQYADGRKELWK